MRVTRRHSLAVYTQDNAAPRHHRPSSSLSPDSAASLPRGTRRRPSYNIDSVADSLAATDSDPEAYVPEPLSRCISECSYSSSQSNLVSYDSSDLGSLANPAEGGDPHLPTWAQVRSQFNHALDLAFDGDPGTHTIPTQTTIRARQAFLKLWTRHAIADRLADRLADSRADAPCHCI